MGGALLEGWLERGIEAEAVLVVEPSPHIAGALRQRAGLTVVDAPGNIGADVRPGIVVFAVKPQAMDAVAPAYKRFAGPGTVFLSIAAGKTIGYFEDRLGADAAIVRSMPNTPAAVRRGITVACPNGLVTPDHQRRCHDLLEAVGEVAWVDDEALLDAVTAVSGGGPAYVFLLVECLARAGADAGLPPDLALRLARVTVSGSGELLRRSTDAPEALRQGVTSPGGTTEQALKVLMAADGWLPILNRGIAAATARSREMAG